MTNREKLNRLTEDLSEVQLGSVIAIVEAHLAALDEAIDDAFCMRLYEESCAADDQSTVLEDDFLRELGIDLDEIQN